MAVVPVSLVCGAAVSNAAGEKLGAITEVMLGHDDGCVAYAVLSHGGVLGIGEKLFAVPWRHFTMDPLGGNMRLEVGLADLQAADGISKDAWPVAVGDDWLTRAPPPAPLVDGLTA